MKRNELIKRILFYLTVPKCVACSSYLSYDDEALCPECKSKHTDNKATICSVCGKYRPQCLCTNDYLSRHYVKRLIKLFVYRSAPDGSVVPSNELIYKLKRSYRRDLIDFVADELARSVISEIPDYDKFVITSVPRSKKRVRKYGYDHAEKVARALAQRLGIKYVKVLKSKQRRAQKLSEGREARMANARFDYCGNKTVPPKVFLFDDVVTSGASMGNCATLLHGIGAKSVVGICMGIAFKDKYVPFATER